MIRPAAAGTSAAATSYVCNEVLASAYPAECVPVTLVQGRVVDRPGGGAGLNDNDNHNDNATNVATTSSDGTTGAHDNAFVACPAPPASVPVAPVACPPAPTCPPPPSCASSSSYSVGAFLDDVAYAIVAYASLMKEIPVAVWVTAAAVPSLLVALGACLLAAACVRPLFRLTCRPRRQPPTCCRSET